MKAQVSTEYLVILAVVLVIAILVVFLISQSSQIGSGVTESQSKNYWNIQAPFSITGWRMSGTTVELEVINRDPQTLTLTQVDADGISRFSTPTKFTTGQTRIIILTGLTACAAGDSVDHDIDFIYTRGNFTVTQNGEKNIIGTCV